ncbi:MAG: 3-phosphoshikimate 1-carboxyvinyltransferase [Bacteroidetes bacterium]|nr:MAG: 3-phosphoshikimate 1-carboxyvinyltransferase [Bacteroidota bacterium]
MSTVVLSPVKGRLEGFVWLPFSKSLSNRHLILGAHTTRPFTITGLSVAEDTHYLVQALQGLGYRHLQEGPHTHTFLPPTDWPKKVQLFAGEGGTTLRFLLPFLARLPLQATVDASPSLRKRPIQPLLEALRRTGLTLSTSSSLYPLVIQGNPQWAPTHIAVDSSLSSQFLSAFMLAAPQLPLGCLIEELSAQPATPSYADMTRQLVEAYGWRWEKTATGWRLIQQPAALESLHFFGEADWSAAVFFWGWAALAEASLVLPLSMTSSQPERTLLLRENSWPVRLTPAPQGLRIEHTGQPLEPFDLDLAEWPDATPALAVMAAFASGPSRLTGLHTLPHKESHRLQALATELHRIGAQTEWTAETLSIYPVSKFPTTPVTFDSHGDHRIAMALSLAAARSPVPLYITGARCVLKSFPHYWSLLQDLGVSLTFVS